MTINRREFLKASMSCALTGAAGCAGMPFWGKPRKDETLVAFLSDCHVGNWLPSGRSVKELHQPRKFTECLAQILRLDPLPARMIISGDLAYLWGRREDYALSKRLLQPIYDAGIDVTIGMGNHDRRASFLEYWPEYAKSSPVKDRIVSVVHGAHFDYLVIDSLNQPEEKNRWITPGILEGEQREWLAAAVRAAKRPFLVVAHHPPHELAAPTTKPRSVHAAGYNFGKLIMGDDEHPTKCVGFIHGHDHAWYVHRSLIHWGKSRIGNSVCLPSTGHWGDIGYALLRERPDRAELSLVQYDYFSPKPLAADAAPRHDWQAIVSDHAQARCTFSVN